MTGATKKEIEKFAKHIINGAIEHLQTSPNTQKQSNDITELLKEKNCVKNESRLTKLENCIYGDKEDETSDGMKVQVMEIHKMLVGAKTGKKMIIGFSIFLSTMIAGYFAVVEFLKNIIK